VPVIPMILVNGADGIGTGWSTNIPPYNPLDIVLNYKKKIVGADFSDEIEPWFKGYTGDIRLNSKGDGFDVFGKYEIIGEE